MARICGAVGAVVHGLMFEREGGSREGVFLENSQALICRLSLRLLEGCSHTHPNG